MIVVVVVVVKCRADFGRVNFVGKTGERNRTSPMYGLKLQHETAVQRWGRWQRGTKRNEMTAGYTVDEIPKEDKKKKKKKKPPEKTREKKI